MGADTPLAGWRVIDLSSGVAGGYCTKLLADAGVEVVKIEDPRGDALRRWTATGAEIARREDGALFEFLACSKRSVVCDPANPADMDMAERLIASADVVVWSRGSTVADDTRFAPNALAARSPTATVVAITPFGLDGPWAHNAATEFTVQAWSGAIGLRGVRSTPPVSVGGRHGEWAAGVNAAIGAMASRREASARSSTCRCSNASPSPTTSIP